MRDIEGFNAAAALLPMELRRAALDLPKTDIPSVEELRLRAGYPPTALISGRERTLPSRNVTPNDLDAVLETATRASAHTALHSVGAGFVTVRGGVRLGLCGEAVIKDGAPMGLRRLSSVCLRVPREARGCADGIWRQLTHSGFESTLIISPPGMGKTTLLRELVRRLSEEGTRVSVADERGEVAGVWEGLPMFNVGPRTDVLTGAPKGEAAMQLIRSMSPEVLAMDEITCAGDIEAVASAAGCGVLIIATAHARSAETLTERPLYRGLLELKIFKRAVTVSRIGSERIYEVRSL